MLISCFISRSVLSYSMTNEIALEILFLAHVKITFFSIVLFYCDTYVKLCFGKFK